MRGGGAGLRRFVAGVGLAVAVPGCGTTVDLPSSGAPEVFGSSTSPGATAPLSVRPSAGSTTGAAGVGTGPVSGGPLAAGSRPAGAAALSRSRPPALGTRAHTRTATRSPVTIGFQVAQNLQAGYAAVGAGGPAPDEGQAVRALAKWVNAHGGLSGHRLDALIHQTNPANGSFASQAQAACSDFTEDHHVLAVVTSPSVGGSDLLTQCLAQHRTVDIEENHWIYDGAYFRSLAPYLYRVGDMRGERWVSAYVDVLLQHGFFAPGAKIGLARFDSPVFQRLSDNVLKPQLAAHGLKLTDEAAIGEPGALSDFGAMSAAIQSTILRFRNLGVDHVLFLENAAELPFFWLPEAENEKYFPAYALTSVDQPWLQAANHPGALAGGAVGVGWMPGADVYDRDHPAGDEAWKRCNDIMKSGGVQNVTNNTWATGAFCEGAFFLDALLARAPSLDAAGLRAAADVLGTGYQSPMTFGPTRFGPGRYDGAEQVGYLRFEQVCTCFRYIGRPQDVP